MAHDPLAHTSIYQRKDGIRKKINMSLLYSSKYKNLQYFMNMLQIVMTVTAKEVWEMSLE